jgi:hypothetical protein
MVERAARDPLLLCCGLIGVAGNVLGVAFLSDIPGAYRLAQLDLWAQGVLAHSGWSNASALSFTLGLIALALWALLLVERSNCRTSRVAGWLIAIGSLFNGLGTLTPVVLAAQVADGADAALPVARALLGLTLTLDAAFNLLLGAGLIVLGASWSEAPRTWWRALAIVGGLASLPVAGQAVHDAAANLLLVSGPLWLLFASVTSLHRWRAT